MANTDKICFDRILPHEIARPARGRMIELSIGRTRAAFEIAKLWQIGQTIRIGFLGGNATQQAQVMQIAPQWVEHANLKLEFGAAANAQVRIAFADDGAWSYIGSDALGIPSNQPTMNFGWLDAGVIQHEFGHMLGMIHEHQNPNTNPIQWNKPAVIAALSGPPNRWDAATIQHNMFDKYAVTQINGSDLDPQSVMLYSFPASWTLNGFHTDPNDKLSDLDKAFARRVYPGQGSLTPPATALTVYSPLNADIGQSAEEDRYRFTADSTAHYVIETHGVTDLVMTVYGANGQKLAQDDDTGEGHNPRIAVDLTPGEYTVQVRHYNQASGTGRYAIGVRKAA